MKLFYFLAMIPLLIEFMRLLIALGSREPIDKEVVKAVLGTMLWSFLFIWGLHGVLK